MCWFRGLGDVDVGAEVDVLEFEFVARVCTHVRVCLYMYIYIYKFVYVCLLKQLFV